MPRQTAIRINIRRFAIENLEEIPSNRALMRCATRDWGDVGRLTDIPYTLRITTSGLGRRTGSGASDLSGMIRFRTSLNRFDTRPPAIFAALFPPRRAVGA